MTTKNQLLTNDAHFKFVFHNSSSGQTDYDRILPDIHVLVIRDVSHDMSHMNCY